MFTVFILQLLGAMCAVFALSVLIDVLINGSARTRALVALSPEIWRAAEAGFEDAHAKKVFRRVLLIAAIFSVTFPIFFVFFQPGIFLMQLLGEWLRGALVGLILWTLLPLPIFLTNQVFVKYHGGLTRAYLFNWLIKLVAGGILLAKIF